MASTDDDALVAIGWLIVKKRCAKNREKKDVKRPVWTKEWLMKRSKYSHTNLLSELRVFPKDWHNYLRMDEQSYLNLLSLITPFIQKKDTVMRQAISPHERLTATLRFLGTGRTYEDLKYSTIISPQALGYMIPETCAVIYVALHKDFLKFPQTEGEWKNITDALEMKWNFPHCIGAMDGKHITIVPPAGSGSEFYNYKGRHSMVLLAIADANYRFILCNFGTNSFSNGGVLKNTSFFFKLSKNLLSIPSASTMRNSNTTTPYVFIADDAFPLREDMMKPFRQSDLISQSRKIFNYRLSRARRIVENLFGILVARFRIFHTAINVKPNNIEDIVMACCVLHNYLMKTRPSCYAPLECFDRENTDEGAISSGYEANNVYVYGFNRNNPGNLACAAKKMREDFMNYFTNEGQVPWQLNFI